VPTPVAPLVLVEDDRSTRELVGRALEEDGQVVLAVGSAAELLALEGRAMSGVVLDLWLPDGNGLDLCREMRRKGSRVPILMLTARADVTSRVRGLDAGADDYLGKPFAVSELRARVRALLRRAERVQDEVVLERGLVRIDLGRRTVSVAGSEVALTRREFDVLERLAASRGHVVQRDDILEDIWGEATPATAASLEVIVARLRRKLGASDARSTLLRTVRGVGYALATEAP
jgi:DNA-binding response OmpR family regulator